MVHVSISHLERVLEDSYLVSCFRSAWEDMGWTVSVGRRFHEMSDLCILHHDVTRLDPLRLPEPPVGVPVLNGKVLDISKRRLSGILLKEGDDWDGPVIVKTDLNHFGGPEFRYMSKSARFINKSRKRLAGLNWTLARFLPENDYPILKDMRSVPKWVWSRNDLIVERFLPERDGDLYCLRGWVFLGSENYGYRLYATDPLVKTGTMVRFDYLEEVPVELMEIRKEWQVDFGKFDYVLHDGKPVLLDINKTPTISGDRASPRVLKLAMAIKEFL